MTANPSVICAGRLYADLIFTGLPEFPTLGTEVFSSGLAIEAGGGAVITAAYLAALNKPTSLLSWLSPAPFGPVLEEKIAGYGIDLSLSEPMPRDSDPQITAAIVMGEDRAFVSRRPGSALPPDSAERVAQSGANHLHIGELATLVEHPEILTASRKAGMTISLDCSWDVELFDKDIKELIASVDVFLPNSAEVRALAAAGVSAPFTPLTVVKMGQNGAEAFSDGEKISAPATPVQAIDTTGAGDAFNAGFLAAWLNGHDLRDCLAEGNRLGAVSVTKIGGMTAAKKIEPA